MIRSHFPFPEQAKGYRGRLAPTPSGPLHLGHVRTFSVAAFRARLFDGNIFLRIEDIDRGRCRTDFEKQAIHLLQRCGLVWSQPVTRQSSRLDIYRQAAASLAVAGWIYPSPHTRKQIRETSQQIEVNDGSPLFPTSLRPSGPPSAFTPDCPWRFRIPDGHTITFDDGLAGKQSYLAGEDFGDFLVWRRDGWPTYELAVVVDDIEQDITEVIRGSDLLKSTARQILLYEAFNRQIPRFAHCPLVLDPDGAKLSKSLSNYRQMDPQHLDSVFAEAEQIARRISPFPSSPTLPSPDNLEPS